MTLTFVRGVGSWRRLSSWTRPLQRSNVPLDIHPEVKDALSHHRPVVALETAVVTHGLPSPTNLTVQLALEDIVRSTGSIPATIGIIQGRIKIGLEKRELERLAETKTGVKVSRRDIAAAIATESDGGTTCSATLVFAASAGIKVFATGGLGGVHRGGEKSLDISADLHELTRCPVGLVSSGVKSILDIKRTLEYLETLGVPVISYGDSKEFPAFFTRRSGYTVPWNANNPLMAAKILHTQQQLGMQNGALIAVPIPEEYEAAGVEFQKMVDQAVKESEENGVSASGNDATPWLLRRIEELTGGKSLMSNVALLKNTALVGGQIAQEYQKLVNLKESCPPTVNSQCVLSKVRTTKDIVAAGKVTTEPQHSSSGNPVVIIGSAAVDITAQERPDITANIGKHSTVPGHVRISSGGVGRNIAEAAHRILQARSSTFSSILVSPIGKDAFGQILSRELSEFGMRTDGLLMLEHEESAVCNMVLDSQGGLIGGVADMEINGRVTADVIIPHLERLAPSLVALDGNLSPSTLKVLVGYCNEHSTKVLFEPTSVVKSVGILPSIASALESEHLRPLISFCTPNLSELNQLYDAAKPYGLMDHPTWWSVIDDLNLGSTFRLELEQLARKPVSENTESGKKLSFLLDQGFIQKAVHLLPFFQHLIIKCGDQGALVVMRITPEDAANSGWRHLRSNTLRRCVVAAGKTGSIVVVQHFPPKPVRSLVNVTGAGDSFVGALLATLVENRSAFCQPQTLEKAISLSQNAAVETLQCHSAVSPLLSKLALYFLIHSQEGQL